MGKNSRFSRRTKNECCSVYNWRQCLHRTGLSDIKGNNKAEKDFWQYNSKQVPGKQLQTYRETQDTEQLVLLLAIKDSLFRATTDKLKFCNDLWEYNPTSNQWVKKSDFPEKEEMDLLHLLLALLLIFYSEGLSGEIGTTNKNVWEYNAQKDKWQKGTDFQE